MKYEKVGIWEYTLRKNIRYRKVMYIWDGEEINDIEFQVFKRPYIWGLIGKKKWEWTITTNDLDIGIGFSLSLISI